MPSTKKQKKQRVRFPPNKAKTLSPIGGLMNKPSQVMPMRNNGGMANMMTANSFGRGMK